MVLIAFLAGALVSRYGLQAEIDATQEAVRSLQQHLTEHVTSLDKVRAFDNLKVTLDVVGYVVDMEKRGAPRRYIGEEYQKLLRKRLATLESIKPGLKESSDIAKSELLLKEAQQLLSDIEFYYL